MADQFTIIDLNYFTIYVKDFEAAVAFYSSVFGKPEYSEDKGRILGWPMGATYLTIMTADQGIDKDRNPCNSEFAIQVARPEEVDLLHRALVEAGATDFWDARDTVMYQPMRYAVVDDPFGVRIDIYCPLPDKK